MGFGSQSLVPFFCNCQLNTFTSRQRYKCLGSFTNNKYVIQPVKKNNVYYTVQNKRKKPINIKQNVHYLGNTEIDRCTLISDQNRTKFYIGLVLTMSCHNTT